MKLDRLYEIVCELQGYNTFVVSWDGIDKMTVKQLKKEYHKIYKTLSDEEIEEFCDSF